MSNTYWLRAESKENEFRRVLVPQDCKTLINQGHKVVVEDWEDSIIPTQNYLDAGCEIVPSMSWINAPTDSIIMGLKALPSDINVFEHTHIYFAHVYKQQDGWRELLSKFKTGGGKIFDLEYMVDENKRRVAAFGYWAGYVGAALGALLTNLKEEDALIKLKEKGFFNNKNELLKFIDNSTHNENLKAIVIGASGRSGQGAADLLESLEFNVTKWDRAETQKGGPFREILDHNLFVNCVLSTVKTAPFINKELLSLGGSLKVISDVSCDPDSEFNMIPIYNTATKLDSIYHEIESIKLTAIDNLPSILPKESSEDFSSQLVGHIQNMESFACKSSLASFFHSMTGI